MKCTVDVRNVKVILNGKVILNDVSLKAEPGEIFTIVGPNGAGKTTLLKALAGIIRITSGSIKVCGYNLESKSVSSLIGYAPASITIDPWCKVIDALIAARYGVSNAFLPTSEDYDEAYRVSELLGITHLLNRYVGSLSGGEGKLVLIASALIRKPRVLLLDEPLAFLDVRNQALIMKLLRILSREGLTIITTSHELHLVSMYSDKVLLLNEGRVVAVGKPNEVLKRDLLETIYNTKLIDVERANQRILIPTAKD